MPRAKRSGIPEDEGFIPLLGKLFAPPAPCLHCSVPFRSSRRRLMAPCYPRLSSAASPAPYVRRRSSSLCHRSSLSRRRSPLPRRRCVFPGVTCDAFRPPVHLGVAGPRSFFAPATKSLGPATRETSLGTVIVMLFHKILPL